MYRNVRLGICGFRAG